MSLLSSTEAPETPENTAISYFSRTEWIWFILFILAGLALRWLQLDVRPIHHDESLHAMYGHYFYDWPAERYYQYDPMLHGPVLYNLYPLVYTMLGISDWSVRAPIAFLGSLFIIFPWVFRKFLTPTTTLALTGIIALSPTMVYWSRLIHHDLLVLFGWFLVLYGASRARSELKAIFVLSGIAFQFAVKSNAYITVTTILGYLAYEYGYKLIQGLLEQRKSSRSEFKEQLACLVHLGRNPLTYVLAIIIPLSLKLPFLIPFFVLLVLVYEAGITFIYRNKIGEPRAEAPLLIKALAYVARHPIPYLLGVVFAIFVFTYFYTSGFRYSAGLLPCNGSYQSGCRSFFWQSFMYWIQQHDQERIEGPVLFHFYILSWYELYFIAVLFLQLAAFYWQESLKVRVGGLLSILLGLGVALFYRNLDPAALKEVFWGDHLNAKSWVEIFCIIFWMLQAIIFTTVHLRRNQRVLAFFAYFYFATFFSYSVAGEKTPWLAIYPFLTGLTYYALFFQNLLAKFPLPKYNSLPVSWLLIVLGCVSSLIGFAFTIEELKTGFNLVGNIEWIGAGFILVGVGMLDRFAPIFPRYNLKVLLFVVVGIFMLRLSIMTNFSFAGRATEIISQVHTSHEFDQMMRHIRHEMELAPENARPKVLVTGESVWPTVWYLRGLPIQWEAPEPDRKNFDYVFIDYTEDPSKYLPGYKIYKLKLRGWWVPDYSQMTLKRYLNYAVNHFPWKPGWGDEPTGYSYCTLMVREK